MKPQSIGRLAGLYILVVAGAILLLAGYLWLVMDRVAGEISAREQASARAEVVEGLAEMERRGMAMLQNLARWDETRQQLSFTGYYSLWRDNRVHDAGMAFGRVEAVALYDKEGHILAPPQPNRPMLVNLPGPTPLALVANERGKSRFYLFLPVHADPDGRLLLGFVGVKLDFIDELKRARAYQFADLGRLHVSLPEGRTVNLAQAIGQLQFATRANSDLAAIHALFRASLVRLVLVILLLLVLATGLLGRLLVQPLRDLSDDIDNLREPGGSLPQPLTRHSPVPVLELENVRDSFNDYQARLSELHSNLEQNSRDFHDQARHDALTGAFNRRAFDEDWKNLGEDRRLGRVALLLFDCDHFKAINDTYGHQVGDVVIQSIATALHAALRANDRLYRLGGDEFATILPEADAVRAEAVAERCIEHVLSQDFRRFGMNEPVTISIGIALSEGEGNTLHELQKHADLAMYTAKRPGSRKLVFYSTDMDGMAALVANKEISAVFQAIANPALLELHYQSVIRLPLAQRDYVEALARIRCEGELIGPAEIFPIVQARNLDVEFDLAVLRALERDLAGGRLPVNQGVSVNLSPPSIVNSKVVDALVALVRTQSERKIVVEITETALITQIEIASNHIRLLREAGALVALDDFGSGYSSLRYLASMPVDLVKFDIGMVHLLANGDDRQQQLLQEIASMVVSAGYLMVAEGVETRELLDKVISLGFSHAQGYYFDRPQTPEQLAARHMENPTGC